MNPAPRTRIPKLQLVKEPDTIVDSNNENLIEINEDEPLTGDDIQKAKTATTANGSDKKTVIAEGMKPSPLRRLSSQSDKLSGKRGTTPEMREQLRRLGPSNAATRPKQTRWASVKIKPAWSSDVQSSESPPIEDRRVSDSYQGGVGEGLLSSAGKDASDGVQAVQAGYGTIGDSPPMTTKGLGSISPETKSKSTSTGHDLEVPRPDGPSRSHSASSRNHSRHHSRRKSGQSDGRSKSPRARHTARSGSITENIVDANGVKKVVLELTSSSSDADEQEKGKENQSSHQGQGQGHTNGESKGNGSSSQAGGDSNKKKKKRKKKNHKNKESQPLLEDKDEE